MLQIRPAGKHAATHRTAAGRTGYPGGVIDGRYKPVGRCKTSTPGCRRWLAHDLRLNRRVLVELRPVHAATTPDAALRAHTELLGGTGPAVLLDAGFWAGRPERPVTYVVTPAPALSPVPGSARRRGRRRGVAQVA